MKSNTNDGTSSGTTLQAREECLKSCESRLGPLKADETLCLNTSLDVKADRKDVLSAINKVTTDMTIYDGDVDGIPWDPEWTYVHANNPHHEEGWLYNHIILMLIALMNLRVILSVEAISILERAIFWSDLGKYHTTKEGKKTWEDGTAISTAFGHDKKSAELLDEAVSILEVKPWWYKPVRWIVANHMKAHSIKVECDDKGRNVIPDWLKPQIDGLAPWDWPEWADLNIPHGVNYGKKDHMWTQLGASTLLRIKQMCDEWGRISNESLIKN